MPMNVEPLKPNPRFGIVFNFQTAKRRMAISVYVVDCQSVTKHLLQGDVRFVEAFELIGIPHYPDDEEKSKAHKSPSIPSQEPMCPGSPTISNSSHLILPARRISVSS